MRTVIGLDIGHSAVKAVALSTQGSTEILFPSVVTKAVRISDTTTARSAKADTVTIRDSEYFVGETAIEQGGAKTHSGLSSDWIGHVEHAALFRAALLKLEAAGIPNVSDATIVLGLPAANYRQQKETLITNLAPLTSASLLVQPQPLGPYHLMMLTEQGAENPEHHMTQESWAVVDVGHFTTDFMLMKRGKWIERAAGSCDGVHLAVNQLQQEVYETHGVRIDALEAEEALKSRKIKNFGKTVDVSEQVYKAAAAVVNQVVDRSTALLGEDVRQLDGVLVAGGGSGLVYQYLKERWPHAVTQSNPRVAVAAGFARFARAVDNIRSAATRVN